MCFSKAKADDSEYPLKNGGCLDSNIDILDDKYAKPRQAHWVLRRVFILTWIRLYDREKAIADLIAGVTLGLTIIPQSIAYAALAGLSSEYGLYSAFIGEFILIIWIVGVLLSAADGFYRFHSLCFLWHNTSGIDWTDQFNGHNGVAILFRQANTNSYCFGFFSRTCGAAYGYLSFR